MTKVKFASSSKWIAASLLLLMMVLSMPVQAAEGFAISVSASRDSLLLGVDSSVAVQWKLPKGLDKFTYQALHGSISDVTVSKNGRKVQAVYTPPEQFFPAVDLVVISATDGTQVYWGYTAIKLIGQGKARIVTSPKATTHVRIGNKKFGPATADATGEAFVDVQVPPGVTFGIDDEGNEVDLQLPKVQTAALFASGGSSQINIDESSDEEMLFIIWSPNGKPGGDVTAPTLQVDLGQVSDQTKISDGAYQARYTVHSSPGPVRFSISDSAIGEIHSQSINLVGKEDFTETAVKIEKVPEKKPVPPAQVPKAAPVYHVGEYRFALAALVGLSTSFTDWLSPAARLDFAVRFPTSTLLGMGVTVGFLQDRQNDIQSKQALHVQTKTQIFPMEVYFWYRFVISPRWYITPSVEAGVGLLSNHITTTFGEDNVQPQYERRLIFCGGGAVTIERALGPGMIAGQLRGNVFIFNKESIDGPLYAVDFLLGYRLVFGTP